MSYKSVVLVMVALVGCAMAAPKPITLEEVGRKIKNLGQRAMPAFRGVCGFVNGYQGYPQGYPPVQGYPPMQGYPQAYPQFPQYYPQFTPSNVPVSNNGGVPSVEGSEQDDMNSMNKVASFYDTRVPQNVPPHVREVFKNFDKLPKIDVSSVNAIEDSVDIPNKLID